MLPLVRDEGAVGAAADAVEEATVEGAVAAGGAGFAVFIVGVVDVVVVSGKVGQAQGWMEGFSSNNCAASPGAEDGLPSAQAVPFDLLVFADRLHLVFHAVFVHFLCFGHFHLLARHGDSPDDGCGAANCVSFWFGLGLFLLGDCAHLVEAAGEHGRVGDVFGGFGELQQDYAGADLEEAHHDCGDGGRGAFEATEEDG